MKLRHFGLLLVISAGCTKQHGNDSSSNASTDQNERETAQIESSQPVGADGDFTPADQHAAEDLEELIQAASKHELARDFKRAAHVRKQIAEQVEDQFGRDSWQARNARLSIKNTEYKMRLTSEQLDLLDRIGKLEQQARQSSGRGRYSEAADTYSRILELIPQVWPERSNAMAHYAIEQASACSASDQYARAEKLLAFALPIQEEILGQNHPEYVAALNLLGTLYQASKRFEQASSVFVRTTELTEEIWGSAHPQYATQLNNLGALWSEMKRYASAEETLTQSLEIRKKTLGEQSVPCADSLYNLGSIHLARRDLALAHERFQQALRIYTRHLAPAHTSAIRCKNSLAACLQGQRQYKEAEVLMRDVAEARRKTIGEHHPDYGQALFRLGVVLREQRKFAEAERLLSQALEIQVSALGGGHPDSLATQNAYAQLLRQTGRGDQAVALEARARAAAQRAASARPAKTIGPLH